MKRCFIISEIVEISPAIWRSGFSFFQGAKAANSKLFNPDSYRDATQKKWKRTSQMGRVILTTSLISMLAVGACNSADNKPNGNTNRVPVSVVNNPLTANGLDTVAAARKPTLDFKDTLHDFGPIQEKEIVSYEFTFTNNGKTPLIITDATGSCGCTVPEYPHDPVAPGQSGIMKVTFNSNGKSFHQEKSVRIHANTLRNVHMLYIKADIQTKK